MAQATTAQDTAAYASAALRALVAAAARGNRLPDSLASYRARIESEIAVSARREDGQEAVLGLEQVASVLRWTRSGYYDQHVVGERARQLGISFSLLSAARTGWTAPVLYGDRLRLRREPERPARAPSHGIARIGDRIAGRVNGTSQQGTGRRGAADTIPIIHPLAADRDAYYRYTGGDTVATLRAPVTGGSVRVTPIVRVHVAPRGPVDTRTGLFVGDLDLDAVQHTVVRLRGRFVVADRPPRSLLARARSAVAPRSYAFVEYVNAERVDEAGRRYWLPATQRIELQVSAPALGDVRAIVRIVSRFRQLAINDTTLAPADLAANADSILPLARRRLTLARGDSLGRYTGWQLPIGTASGALHAEDFDDLVPGLASRGGPPAASVYYPHLSDLVHFNRVEGLYAGLGGRVRFRDAAPGLAVGATGGYAGAERTARGRVEVEQQLDHQAADELGATADGTPGARWSLLGRAGRTLDVTNDFRAPFDSGSSIGALLGYDDYDYVDRRFATVGFARLAPARASLVRFDIGVVEDQGERTRLEHGLLRGTSRFRANRGVDEGRYLRSTLTLAWHPDVAAEYLRPGVGARFTAQNGIGQLRYTRLEGRLTGRRDLIDGTGAPSIFGVPLRSSTLALLGRLDAGVVLAPGPNGPPPQQLFELGGIEGLRGYRYKEFAGDEAASLRSMLVFTGPFLRTPIRLWRFLLPALAPGVGIEGDAGYTAASSAAALRSIARLGGPGAGTALGARPVARPTGRARSTVRAGVTLFGGGVFIGLAG